MHKLQLSLDRADLTQAGLKRLLIQYPIMKPLL